MKHEWNTTTLAQYIKEYLTLSNRECLEKMISRPRELQTSLPSDYHSEEILKNILLTACVGIEETRIARQKVAPTLEGVVADLYTSTPTSDESCNRKSDEKNPTMDALITAYVTERRKLWRPKHRKHRFKKKRENQRCIVCKKIGCWSTALKKAKDP